MLHIIVASIDERQTAKWSCSCGADGLVATEYANLTTLAQSHAPSSEPIRLTIERKP